MDQLGGSWLAGGPLTQLWLVVYGVGALLCLLFPSLIYETFLLLSRVILSSAPLAGLLPVAQLGSARQGALSRWWSFVLKSVTLYPSNH